MKYRILLLAIATTGLASASSYTNYSGSQFTQGTLLDFNVAKFNSSLGTLTGVTVTVTSGDLQGSPTVKNTTTGTVGINAISDTFFVTTAGPFSSGRSTILGFHNGTVFTSPTVTTPAMGSVTILAGETQSLSIDAGQSTNIEPYDVQAINPPYFSAYQSAGGSGSVNFKAQNIFAITTTGASYEVSSPDVGVNTEFAITYTYSAIPESSSALLGGLGMLALLRRRRA